MTGVAGSMTCNLVCDPVFLVVAWNRVRTNRGTHTAGVDGETAHYVEARRGASRSRPVGVLREAVLTSPPSQNMMVAESQRAHGDGMICESADEGPTSLLKAP